MLGTMLGDAMEPQGLMRLILKKELKNSDSGPLSHRRDWGANLGRRPLS